jgi:hypothetical protein
MGEKINDYQMGGIINGISMNKLTILLIAMVTGLVPLLLVSCADDEDSNFADDSPWKIKKKSFQIAEDFLGESPTFTYDGIKGSVEQALGEEAVGPDKWRYLFSFSSKYEGYGDRTGEQLSEKRTYHEVLITVADGEVTKAVMDGDWDMIDQTESDDWEWGEAGEQALYGAISVFTILIMLTIMTRASGSIISRIEKKQDAAITE